MVPAGEVFGDPGSLTTRQEVVVQVSVVYSEEDEREVGGSEKKSKKARKDATEGEDTEEAVALVSFG
jgi:hypothetical protein